MNTTTVVSMVAFVLGVVLSLSGCASDEPPAFIVLGPVVQAPTVAARPAHPTASVPMQNVPAANAVVRDTGALQRRAAAYVYRRNASPAVIDGLTDLTKRMQEALQRLRDGRRGQIYRAEDIAAARSAADTLAAFLAAQGQPGPKPVAASPPLSPSP